MKKIFIIMCGILTTGAAFGVIDDYFTDPKKESTYETNWLVDNGFTAPASNFKLAGEYKSKRGTFGDNDEGAIVATIARDIYENGGYFCTTQIQAAHRNGRRYIWLDYYEPLNGSRCAPFCKENHYGANCDLTTPQTCDQTNYQEKFKATLKTSGGYDVQKYTKDIPVFDYQNQRANTNKQAYHVVLGIVEYKQHGVIVAPVKVVGERDGVATWGQKSWIDSARYSNGKTTLLCAEGYEPNASGTDCNETSWCKNKKQLDQLCPGYTVNEYDASIHELKKIGSDNCYQIRCFTGKGFQSKTNRTTCVDCEGGSLAYVDENGLCQKCEKGQVSNKNHTGCDTQNLRPYSKSEMKSHGDRQCWMETDYRKFAGCVNGCSGNAQCWIDKHCKSCDN